MPYQIEVDNIKCGGCANSIVNKLMQLEGINTVDVRVESGTVVVDGSTETQPQAVQALNQLGYPEKGTVEGLQAAGAKAKSYVSCAVGRLNDK